MAQFFEVHPVNPQARLLKQAAQILQDGGIAAVPTDSSYALVCRLDDKAAAEQLRRIRQVVRLGRVTALEPGRMVLQGEFWSEGRNVLEAVLRLLPVSADDAAVDADDAQLAVEAARVPPAPSTWAGARKVST